MDPLMLEKPVHEIRAQYTDTTIRVYQAYSDEIADAALAHQTFISPPFKKERMTWIKPSFLWMMYRSGWGKKDTEQRRILAIDITREGFEWALKNSCLSHKPEGMSQSDWLELKSSSPVRIQWDPERNIFLEPLPYRAIQIGLSGKAVELYINQWIVQITDVTNLVHLIYDELESCNVIGATILLPKEKPYPNN